MAKAPNAVAVHAAIARYAPSSVTRVANSVLNPEVERLYSMVVARPKSIRRVPANLLSDVLRRISSVDVIASLINVGDKRRAMRDHLLRHPKYARAHDLNIDKAHPWADHDVDTVISTIEAIIRDRHMQNDDIRRVVTWCRRQHADIRADVYRRVYNIESNGRTAILDLYIDVLTGSVPGLTVADLGHVIDPEKPKQLPDVRSSKQESMKTYPRLTLALAEICTANGLNPPLDSIDSVDDDAFEHLLHSSSAVKLIENGLLDDPRRLLPFIEEFDARVLVQLAQHVYDPEVIAALVKDIPYGLRTYVDLYYLLNTVPDLDRDTRMVLLTYASTTEMRDHLNGLTLNQPEHGDATRIVRTILDPLARRWNIQGAGSLAHVLSTCSPTVYAIEAVNTFLDDVEGMVDTILGSQGLLGRIAVERITNTFGSDQQKWEMLLRLAPDWTGNLDGLISAAAVL
jgi:hypothetical protein